PAALSDYSKAISLDPRMQVAYKARSETYKKMGKGKEEKADLAKLYELNPSLAPKKPGKKTDEGPARFLVESKPVAASKRAQTLKSAKEIDRLVDSNYAKTNTKPNPKTTDAEFVRRIYLDITGTIPSYTQTTKFLAATEPDKRTQLIDELLNG